MEIKVLKNILSANDRIAARNRQLLDAHKIFAVNVMASPGAGKTSFILETIKQLRDKVKIGVIEGDISSNIDAVAVSRTGVPVVQINTGGECHIDANMFSSGIGDLPLADIRLLFIENVGNLVCPAEFTLGEDLKILVSHTPEGDDKPFKYPLMFQTVDAVVVNKIDLLPYVRFDMASFSRAVKSINDRVTIFPVSCTTGEGIQAWAAWLLAKMKIA